MFESIYQDPDVVRRHREAVLSAERAAFLREFADRGAVPKSLRNKARHLLWLVSQIGRWPADHRFTDCDLDALSSAWTSPKSRLRIRSEATRWLAWLDRLSPPPALPPAPYEDELDDFVATQRQLGLAEETCKNRQKQVRRFLSFIKAQGWTLADLTSPQIDAYFDHMGRRWSRGSVKQAATSLRAWLLHCQRRSWSPPRLAAVVLSPRIYRFEGLPLGPTWAEVRMVVSALRGDEPLKIRDRAIVLLLAVYGLRSGEVRRISLDDIDWESERLRVVRSKTRRVDVFPLEPSVSTAIARYVRDVRRCGSDRTLFLTQHAPRKGLSWKRLHEIVQERFSSLCSPPVKCSPRLLRHACAQRLLETGTSMKQIGDHLGHRDHSTTGIYAKVNLKSLRLVAMEDLGGLA